MTTPIPGIAGPGAGYPQWGVVAGSPGQHVTKISNAAAKTLMETVSFPSKVLFFTTQQAAENWVNSNGGQTFIPGTKAPLNAANNLLNTATDPTAFLKALFTRANAVRLAEGLLGVVLIAVAAAELGKGTAIGNLAKKVPLV